MRKLLSYWLLGLLLLPSAAWAEVEVVVAERSTTEALFINLRVKHDEDRGWLLRGRLSRAAKNNKVPDGYIFARFEDAQGQFLGTLNGQYKPLFVHRKTDRASYFTIEIPQQLMNRTAIIEVSHRRESE